MPIDQASPLRVVAFLEAYLQPEQTFIYRQMTQLPHCDVTFVVRHVLPNNPYPCDRVRVFGRPSKRITGRLAWWRRRVRQLLSGRYASLLRSEQRQLEDLLRELKPSIVHAHWGPDAMLVAPTCQRLGVPLLVHFHGYDASSLTKDRFYRRSLRRTMAVGHLGLTVSEDSRQRLIALGCPASRTISHHTGVPEEYFRSAARSRSSGDRFQLIHVGRLADGKGHSDTLEAFARALPRLPGLTLRIIGEGPLFQQLQQWVATRGAAASVTLVGRLRPEGVVDELRGADALIAPFRATSGGSAEGLPNVVVEALAARVPVIATRHGGIPEAVRYSENGWLVEEGDVAALAERIERLAQQPSLWARLSDEGHAIAAREFHLPSQNRRLVRIYHAFVKGSAGDAVRAAQQE